LDFAFRLLRVALCGAELEEFLFWVIPEITNVKTQISNNFQIANPKTRKMSKKRKPQSEGLGFAFLRFGNWTLFGFWNLKFGFCF
jgi:hypothetical protein